MSNISFETKPSVFFITDPTSGASPPLVTMIGLTLTGGDSGDGGAIDSEAQLELRNCIVTSNFSATNGGGIFHRGADLLLQNCTISGNHANDSGGGLYSSPSDSDALLKVENCNVTNNTSEGGSGGGIGTFLINYESLSVENSVISGNSAGGQGGGIWAETFGGSTFPTQKAVTISRSTISGNTSVFQGGGVFALNFSFSETLIDQSSITGNSVTGTSRGNGGGVYAYVFDESAAGSPKFTISASTVANNTTTQDGGGIFVCGKHDGTFVAENSTLSNNSTTEPGGDGGGIFIADPGADEDSIDAYLVNTTITQNYADEGTGGGVGTAPFQTVRVRLYNSIVSKNFADSAKTTPDNLAGLFDTANVKYNLVGSGPTIFNLANPTSPAFLDTTNINSATPSLNDSTPLGDLQYNGGLTETHALLAGSPAIDAGSSTYAFDPLTTIAFSNDQRSTGFTRFYDIAGVGANGGTPKPIDIGAYEMQMPKFIDVILDDENPISATPDASLWGLGPISYAKLVAMGQQLAPVYRAGTNTIKIAFSEALTTYSSSAFTLFGKPAQNSTNPSTMLITTFSYDATTNIVTLGFSSATFLALPADRYRLDIEPTGISGLGGSLDGEWSDHVDPNNPNSARYDNGTLYDWTDDQGRNFPSGNGMGGTKFQFKFALDPGDYDQNGIVDLGDYTVWRNSDPRADGNGDGSPGGSGDYDVWRAALDSYLWLQQFQGDYNKDGIVNGADYAIWRSQFDNHYDPANPDATSADGSLNGIVDAIDYSVWRDWQNTESPWHISILGSAAGSLLIDSTNAPQVVNVTISGSSSTHTPYSFTTHVGSGVQLQTVPVGGADTISITFSEQVNVEAIDLKVVGLTTANVPTLVSFSYDPLTFTATWQFTGMAAADFYALTLSDAVTDTQGYRLDGEWTNPMSITTTNSSVSHFPSGNGHAGGNFVFVFTLIPDANGDNIVDEYDRNVAAANAGLAGTFADGDYSGNGMVGAEDSTIWEFANWADLESVGILGDLNHDMRVDDADVDIIVGNYGMTSPTYADGDLNWDGHIDSADMDLIFAQYGLELSVA